MTRMMNSTGAHSRGGRSRPCHQKLFDGKLAWDGARSSTRPATAAMSAEAPPTGSRNRKTSRIIRCPRTTQTEGVFVIAVTPFTEAMEIGSPSIDRMVDFYFEKGADGLTILGMMGEAPKLTQSEAIHVTRCTIGRAGPSPSSSAFPLPAWRQSAN